MKFVRIRPFNKQRGQLTRRYVFRGFRFEESSGWYQVPDDVADALQGMLTFPDNPDSKPVFDVCTEEEAKAMSVRDYEDANPNRKIEQAISGAQTVTEDKMPDAAPDVPKVKAKAAKRAAPAEPAPEKAPAEPEKVSGKRTPFGA